MRRGSVAAGASDDLLGETSQDCEGVQVENMGGRAIHLVTRSKPVAMKVITGKTARPSTKKVAPPRKIIAKPAVKKGAAQATGKKAAPASLGKRQSADGLATRFDNTL
jgi:hypothetical protein